MSNQNELLTLVKIGYTMMLSAPIIGIALMVSEIPEMFSPYVLLVLIL